MGMIPGGGWMAVFKNDDGTFLHEPVVAWDWEPGEGLVAYSATPEGEALIAYNFSTFDRVYHPDAHSSSVN